MNSLEIRMKFIQLMKTLHKCSLTSQASNILMLNNYKNSISLITDYKKQNKNYDILTNDLNTNNTSNNINNNDLHLQLYLRYYEENYDDFHQVLMDYLKKINILDRLDVLIFWTQLITQLNLKQRRNLDHTGNKAYMVLHDYLIRYLPQVFSLVLQMNALPTNVSNSTSSLAVPSSTSIPTYSSSSSSSTISSSSSSSSSNTTTTTTTGNNNNTYNVGTNSGTNSGNSTWQNAITNLPLTIEIFQYIYNLIVEPNMSSDNNKTPGLDKILKSEKAFTEYLKERGIYELNSREIRLLKGKCNLNELNWENNLSTTYLSKEEKDQDFQDLAYLMKCFEIILQTLHYKFFLQQYFITNGGFCVNENNINTALTQEETSSNAFASTAGTNTNKNIKVSSLLHRMEADRERHKKLKEQNWFVHRGDDDSMIGKNEFETLLNVNNSTIDYDKLCFLQNLYLSST
ncbi:Ctk3p SCDLUD_001272 [Saccharomycodes ludwigii]|uniref:Ctk3p n=1 Tax=Saccharomycodes ludwigii TaxID=36035 RepID=UPI001E89EC31|nr:hypothetical protein SCDLUD_001272 [Saccharomycodes ludwigii]KAH3903627.1 hypothetical protein SCDLUD_001272 [Saccharomycodes ludwigii]